MVSVTGSTVSGVSKYFRTGAQSISPGSSTAIFGDRGSIIAMNIVTWWHYYISPYIAIIKTNQ